MGLVDDLWLTMFVRWLLGSYGNGFKDAFAKFKDKESTKGGCNSLVAFERFVRYTLLYWVALPFIVIFALPLVVILLGITIIHCAFRFLLRIGISVKCMLSALQLAVEALALYIIASLLWWFFKCVRPWTLDVLWNAIIALCAGVWLLVLLCANGVMWYIHLIAPCWVQVVFDGSRGSYIVLAFVLVIVGGVIALCSLPFIDRPDKIGWAILSMGFVIMMCSLGAAAVGGMTPDYRVNGVHIVGAPDCDASKCIVTMSDGVRYAILSRDQAHELQIAGNSSSYTIDVIKSDAHVCKDGMRSYSDGCGDLGYEVLPVYISDIHDSPVS